MEWEDVANKVANFAPMVGGLLGGPPGAAIGTGVKLLASLFGLKEEEVTPDSIEQILLTDPEAGLKLRQMELDNQADIRKCFLSMRSMELGDLASARAREVAVVQATGRKDLNLYIMAWVILGGFIGLIMALIVCQFTFGKTLQNDPLLTLLLGSLSTDAGMVVGYFYGSSKGSAEKTQLLAGK